MKDFDKNSFFDLDDFEFKEIFDDIESIWEVFFKFNKFFKEQKLNCIESPIPASCYLENIKLIHIAENVKIEPNTYIKGPCIIGKNSEVRHGSYIRGNVITGHGCIIGHTTEVKNSILLNKAHAAHFAYIGDSIIGNNVNLGAGVKLANFRLDKKEISIFLKNQKFKTGLTKLGSIIGDNSQIGCNSVLNPATFLEKNVICYPCLNIRGYIPSNSVVKPEKKTIITKLKVLKNESYATKNI